MLAILVEHELSLFVQQAFPAMFTQVLSQQGLRVTIGSIMVIQLGLYNLLAYIADDAVMVTIAGGHTEPP